MRILAIWVAMAAAAIAADHETVRIHWSEDAKTPFEIKAIASNLLDKIFGRIGIELAWEKSDRAQIEVHIDASAAPGFMPGALAYTAPYQGTRIVVIYDRIRDHSEAGYLLGFTIAHEIAHVLQGVSRHSAAGIMKAAWTSKDYRQMRGETLRFEPRDVELIFKGLESWRARVALQTAPAK